MAVQHDTVSCSHAAPVSSGVLRSTPASPVRTSQPFGALSNTRAAASRAVSGPPDRLGGLRVSEVFGLLALPLARSSPDPACVDGWEGRALGGRSPVLGWVFGFMGDICPSPVKVSGSGFLGDIGWHGWDRQCAVSRFPGECVLYVLLHVSQAGCFGGRSCTVRLASTVQSMAAHVYLCSPDYIT